MSRLLEILRLRRAALLLEGAMALVAVAVVLLAPNEASGTARVELSRAGGTLSLANSREGAAIFQAVSMRPGARASGSVRVTNTGSLGAALTVGVSGPPQTADAPGRLLAARLQLAVLDVTDGTRPVTVYSGPLATMAAVPLGALAAGHGRDFLFVASLPAGTPAADDLVQGAALAVGFTWTATAAAVVTPTPTPTVVPPGPTPTPTPTVTPTPTPTPVPGACRPRRVRIRIHARGRTILKVTVKVGHNRARRVKPQARVKLKVRVAHGRSVRVKVTATLSGGRVLVVKKRVKSRC